MKTFFHTEFFKSFGRIRRHGTWWYKTYEFFKYDIWRFFRNLYNFRRELWNFYPWDYVYNLKLLKKSMELTVENIEKYGNEIEHSRNKKVAKMKRAIELLENFIQDNFIEQSEKEIGREINLSNWRDRLKKIEDKDLFEFEDEPEDVQKLNSEIYDRARKIENEQWKELWDIFHGQNPDDFKSSDPDDWEKTSDEHDQWYDGSGMKGWWD